ncbi:hypothetical protein EGW08_014187, partial [Elysia chlorotica]
METKSKQRKTNKLVQREGSVIVDYTVFFDLVQNDTELNTNDITQDIKDNALDALKNITSIDTTTLGDYFSAFAEKLGNMTADLCLVEDICDPSDVCSIDSTNGVQCIDKCVASDPQCEND